MIFCPSLSGLWTSFPGFRKLPITSVALFGDSITAQGSAGLYTLDGDGYFVHQRYLCGSGWDPCPNGSVLTFATSGATTATLIANHLDDIAASAADTVFDGSGINDSVQNVTLATTLANRSALWEAALAAGKQVIALAVIPLSLEFTGNGAGVISARIAAQNAAIEALASSYRGVFFVNHKEDYEATPGSGLCIANSDYDEPDPDNIHPNSLGASILGRGLNTGLQLLGFTYGIDPFSNTNRITPNGDFSAGTVTPTNFTCFNPSNGGQGTNSVFLEEGIRWWRIPMLKQTSTSYWNPTNFQANTGGSPANKTADAVCRLRVISGVIDNLNLILNATPTGQIAFDGSDNTSGKVYPEDGVIVLRTLRRTAAGDVSLLFPSLLVRAVDTDATIDISELTVREYP